MQQWFKNCWNNCTIQISTQFLENSWNAFNYEIILHLKWSGNCFIVATNIAAQATAFSITDTKVYVPAVTLASRDNAQLLEQLKSGFKKAVNWRSINKKTKSILRFLNWSKFSKRK